MPRDTTANVLFASYNIHKCVGTDRRFDPERVAEVIAEIGPDVIALQEADRRFGDRAGLLDLAALERRTGLVPVPANGRPASHGWHGNLVLVKAARISDVRQVKLPGLEPRGALVTDLEFGANPVRVVAAHLGLLRQSRLMQIDAILSHAGEEAGRPTVLLGDMNEWRKQRGSALGAVAQRFGPLGQGVPSFPSYFPMLALDRIFAQPHGILERMAAHDSPLARKASDHLPITAIIRIDGEISPEAESAAASEPALARLTGRALLSRTLASAAELRRRAMR